MTVSVDHWEDIWLGAQPLKDSFPILKKEPISGFISNPFQSFEASQISWDLKLGRNLRENEIPDFCSILDSFKDVRINEEREDFRVWVSDRGGLLLQIVFVSLVHNDHQSFPFSKTIWKPPVPKTVQFFSWLLVHERILTCDRIQK